MARVVRRWDDDVRWHLDQVEPPTDEPLDVEFVRDKHLRTTNGNFEDVYIEKLIRVARRAAERETQRALMRQTFALSMDCFNCTEIELPRPPLIEVVDISYVNSSGDDQVWAPSAYQVSRAGSKRARIRPAYGTSFPSARDQMDAVTITYVAGYVDTLASPMVGEVPEEILHGMLLLVAELYKQRSESVIVAGVVPTINPAYRTAKSLWWPFRVFG